MDKKIDTFKSGPFTFTANYNKDSLRKLLAEASLLYGAIADIPILPGLAARLEEDLIKRSIFGTAAIEGNPLSEEDVKKVLSSEDVTTKVMRAEKQIHNLKIAYQIIKKTPYSDKPLLLKEETICELNRIITTDCEEPENIPGRYRNHAVKVGDEAHGGVYTPPKIFEDIKALVGHFVEWMNSPDLLAEDAAIRACLAHYYLALIHPFGNGNGRTARAVEAILLKSAGIKFVPHMLSNYYYKSLDDYFLAFSQSERNDSNDITPFVEFFLKGFVLSLREIRNTIYAWIRMLTLRDFYKSLRKSKEITQRQFDLISLLLDYHQEFSLNDLYENSVFRIIYRRTHERTARRDLNRLKEMKLIVHNKEGRYELNDRILDEGA